MIKKTYKKFEQIILFYSLLIYMGVFSYVNYQELQTSNWMAILWLIQFFGLATLLGLYSKKRGWKWPQR
jgi:hypothetical protein